MAPGAMRPAGLIGAVDARPSLVCALNELVGSGRSMTGPGWGPFAAAGAASAMDSADNPTAVASMARATWRRKLRWSGSCDEVRVWLAVVFMTPPF
jgi:hypothetical protein